MLTVHPLLVVFYGVPQNQLSIHATRSHELQLRHRYHTRHILVMALHANLGGLLHQVFSLFLVVVTKGSTQWSLLVGLKAPHCNSTIVIAAVEHLVERIP